MKTYHPDVYPGAKADAERISKQLTEAYGVLGDPKKRTDYDRRRQTQNSTSDDFQNQKEWDTGQETRTDSRIEDDWKYVVRYHPSAAFELRKLKELSPTLAFSFQIAILEAKSAHNAQRVGEALQKQFLERFFGTNQEVHDFVLRALWSNRRDVAVEVNRAIKVLGTPDSTAAHAFLYTVRRITSWEERATPPSPPPPSPPPPAPAPAPAPKKDLYLQFLTYFLYITIGAAIAFATIVVAAIALNSRPK